MAVMMANIQKSPTSKMNPGINSDPKGFRDQVGEKSMPKSLSKIHFFPKRRILYLMATYYSMTVRVLFSQPLYHIILLVQLVSYSLLRQAAPATALLQLMLADTIGLRYSLSSD